MSDLTRRSIILGLPALAGLAACGKIPALDGALALAKAITFGFPDMPLSREKIDQIPYATAYAKLGWGPRTLIVLDNYEGQDLRWVSPDAVALVTRQGRVIKTAGLPDNMRASRFLTTDPVAGYLHRLDEPVSCLREVDFDKDGIYGLTIDSVFETAGARRITILERAHDTILVRERCRARHVNWRFENLYWADLRTGFPWKSVQHISRHFDPVDIEILKPATQA